MAMPGRFESFSFSINPEVGFGSGGEDKHHFIAALAALEALIKADRISAEDDEALAALTFLKGYMRDEC